LRGPLFPDSGESFAASRNGTGPRTLSCPWHRIECGGVWTFRCKLRFAYNHAGYRQGLDRLFLASGHPSPGSLPRLGDDATLPFGALGERLSSPCEVYGSRTAQPWKYLTTRLQRPSAVGWIPAHDIPQGGLHEPPCSGLRHTFSPRKVARGLRLPRPCPLLGFLRSRSPPTRSSRSEQGSDGEHVLHAPYRRGLSRLYSWRPRSPGTHAADFLLGIRDDHNSSSC
jgi:hypothetical protein